MQKFDKPALPLDTNKTAQLKTTKIKDAIKAKSKTNNLAEVAKIASQNPASAVNAADSNKPGEISENPKKQNWFIKFFSKIFGF